MTTLEGSRLDQMDSKIDELTKSLDEIKKALLGSDYTNGKGLVKETAELKERVTSLELWKLKFVSAAAAIGLLLGWVISRAWEYYNK